MKYLILLIGIIIFTDLSAQQDHVQAKIKKNTTSDNCVDIYAKSDIDFDAPPSNYVMSVSIPEQTSNTSVNVSNLLPGMILDVNNPSPYTHNGRIQYDLNIVQDGNPPNINWTANTDYQIATICFEGGDLENTTVQINDLATQGPNSLTVWYFELQRNGDGDFTNYSEKFYDDGGATSNAYNGADSYAETTESISLAISIAKFSAEKYNSSSSYLSWTAHDLVDFDKFEIQRSIDGRNWVYAGTVNTYQFSRSNDFSFVDMDVYDGVGDQTIYYRLRMIDLDGGYRFSKVESVIFEAKDMVADLEIYPNPSSEKVYFTLSGIKEGSSVNITIFDNSGKMVYRKDLDRLSKSNLLLDNQRLNMDSGVYNVLITDDKGNRVYKKLILTK